MDSLSDDNIFELMKHLGRANFTFRAVSSRFRAIFDKNRAILEKKDFVIYASNITMKNWAIIAYNLLFPDHVVVIWTPGLKNGCLLDEFEGIYLKPEFSLTEFFIGISKCETIDGHETIYGKVRFVKFGPQKRYPIYFGKASWDDEDCDRDLFLPATMKYSPSPEYLEKFEKYLNRNIFNNLYEHFIKGTKLEEVFGAAINQHLDWIWD